MFPTVTNWPLYTCTTVLHYGHTFLRHRHIALHCMHYGITLRRGTECDDITLWAYLSEPLVKDSHKRLSLTEKRNTIPRAPTYVITHLPLRKCYGEGSLRSPTPRTEGTWLSTSPNMPMRARIRAQIYTDSGSVPCRLRMPMCSVGFPEWSLYANWNKW